MTDIAQILRDLRDTEAERQRLHELAQDMAEYEALEINLLSLEKRERLLRTQFEEISAVVDESICDYRIIPELPDRYPLAAIGACLQKFQELFSIVFDAVKNKPKLRAHISAEVLDQSTLNFGYAYSGSLGFAFTVPSERLLLIESEIDMAARLFLSILKCESPDDIRKLVPTVGVASITRAYELSQVHGSYAFNTQVQWRKGGDVTHDVMIHAADFERLRAIIDETGEEETETFEMTGRLVGLDVDTNYFHMTFPGAEDLKGSLSDGFFGGLALSVPGLYQANLMRKWRLHYSTGQEDEDWILLQLRPISSN